MDKTGKEEFKHWVPDASLRQHYPDQVQRVFLTRKHSAYRSGCASHYRVPDGRRTPSIA